LSVKNDLLFVNPGVGVVAVTGKKSQRTSELAEVTNTYAHLVTPSLPNQRLISFWAFSTLFVKDLG
jgi:hypothetical protein